MIFFPIFFFWFFFQTGEHVERKVDVAVTTLDSLLAEEDVRRQVTFLKIGLLLLLLLLFKIGFFLSKIDFSYSLLAEEEDVHRQVTFLKVGFVSFII